MLSELLRKLAEELRKEGVDGAGSQPPPIPNPRGSLLRGDAGSLDIGQKSQTSTNKGTKIPKLPFKAPKNTGM